MSRTGRAIAPDGNAAKRPVNPETVLPLDTMVIAIGTAGVLAASTGGARTVRA